ncbi:hypothetical protein HMPREF9120_00958 [Neisseria sp. oral taxon 020 str. F0370]|nr:hypothetical protein HMPREF9120_00958 [Neisseria sp. oral taxon 020 str. F0370]
MGLGFHVSDGLDGSGRLYGKRSGRPSEKRGGFQTASALGRGTILFAYAVVPIKPSWRFLYHSLP